MPCIWCHSSITVATSITLMTWKGMPKQLAWTSNIIGVGRGGARGGQAPPIIWEGGQHTLWPPNNPPICTGKTIPLNSILEFSIISYFKMRNVIIWHWLIKNLMGTRRRNDVDATSLRRHVPAGNLAHPWPPQNSKPWPPQYSKPSYAYEYDTLKALWTIFHHQFRLQTLTDGEKWFLVPLVYHIGCSGLLF